jgi:hypothetical protein
MMVTRGKRYTEPEDDYLRENYGKLAMAVIMKELGRPRNSVRKRAGILGVTGERGHNVKNGKAQMMGTPPAGEEMTLEQALDEMERKFSWSDVNGPLIRAKAIVARIVG